LPQNGSLFFYKLASDSHYMFSYWEQQSFSQYDYIIIGSGIVGLSSAIELKERQRAASVLVLERGLLPTGASTRNAGFACMGSLTELLDDAQYAADEQVVALYARRKKGLDMLRARLGDDRIRYRANGSYELISDAEMPALAQMERMNELLLPVTGKPAFRLANEQIGLFGFSPSYTRALVENTCEGELHIGMMMRAMTDYALQLGVEIKTGAGVTGFEEAGETVTVLVPDALRGDTWQLRCRKLLICTNAFTRQLLPGEDVTPGRGQVLVTAPIDGLPFKGVYHFDKGYYYFRELDGRVLLGGGRNKDFAGETTTAIALSDLIQQDLEQQLREVILPGHDFRIDYRWAGIMGFGNNKQPLVKSFSAKVFGAFRMGGMGVALGTETAAALVDIVMN
jgi:glycine/D-amino acid oxidase-like deaminating enzyme